MRVLFTSTPGWGHVNPMVPLARAFERRGDEVLWALPTSAAQRLEGQGFAVHACGTDGGVRVADVVREHPEIAALPPPERPDHVFAHIFGGTRAAPMLRDLQPLIDEWRPDLVVRDAGEFAAPIAAARSGTPCVTHAFGALLPEVRTRRAAESLAPLWEAAGLEPRPHGGAYDHLYLDIYPPSLQPQKRPHVPATQHLRPADPPGQAHPLPAGVREGEQPLVYLTFGTVFNDVGPLRVAVEGARELDVRLVVTVGPAADPASLGPQPDNVHVASYVPQDQLLAHCRAVVSHAGSGTFLAAAAAGLPQLCLPQGADQYLNAEACTRAGVGVSLPQPTGAEHVRGALHELLTRPSFSSAAQQLATDVAAMPTADEVADRLARDHG